MKDYIVHHEWSIVEEGFHPEYNEVTESLMSLGNGSMGQRGNFEEYYSGNTLQGNYVGGVYYPDKTRVGWWKNGYPEYFAKVLNNVNWIGLHIKINEERLDLHQCDILEFRRELNMEQGILYRTCKAKLPSGIIVSIQSKRFCSIHNREIGALQYELSIDTDAKVEVVSFLDFDVANADSNYDEKFWTEVDRGKRNERLAILAKTNKLDFHVAAACDTQIRTSTLDSLKAIQEVQADKNTGSLFHTKLSAGETISITKTCAVLSSLNHSKNALLRSSLDLLEDTLQKPYTALERAHIEAWRSKWDECDILIDGDTSAQQGIRFNIFQLYQTYTGEDERLNIGPKGFTGEKYGGSTYWDTEAYCLPFYLSTADPSIAKQLLIYRYRHLDKAIENAEKLGFTNGAALYPMVTMNGEECHNEWEITFEEIHRNGAIAHGIYNYVNYTQDQQYLAQYGLEVLIGIARFWSQRVHWSAYKKHYVMLGVTGPNEFENNVNNNWYTNYLASWCLRYCKEALDTVAKHYAKDWDRIASKVGFATHEIEHWEHIVKHMYYPKHPEMEGVVLQQDGFLDKELIPVSELPEDQRPIVEHWSWDRILRSVYIKQGDVLQGMYFLEQEFDTDTIRKNFNFYEPFTVHESSLSPCIHSVIAAKIGDESKAYEYYLRTARLDLDDYNNDTCDGLHITSMAGSWLAVVQGFAGMRVYGNRAHFKPFLPEKWKGYTFRINYQGATLSISVNEDKVIINNLSNTQCAVSLYGVDANVGSHETIEQKLQQAMA